MFSRLSSEARLAAGFFLFGRFAKAIPYGQSNPLRWRHWADDDIDPAIIECAQLPIYIAGKRFGLAPNSPRQREYTCSRSDPPCRQQYSHTISARLALQNLVEFGFALHQYVPRARRLVTNS